MNININVIGQKMCITSCDEIVSGTQLFVRFKFNFDEDWNNLTVFAQFQQGNMAYNEYLDENCSVFLPTEIKSGKCILVLYGVKDKVIATTNFLILNILENKVISDANSTEISESLYNQLVSQVNDLKENVTDLNDKLLQLTAATNIETWGDISNVVKLGLAPTLFPVGYEFTTYDSKTGRDIIWVVRGHDHHKASNSKIKHTMTLETKYVYSSTTGNYFTMGFCPPEAFYYAETEMPAGTYHFTWDYNNASIVSGTFQFTLSKPVPAGGQIVINTASSSLPIAECKISTFSSISPTTPIESEIDITEGNDGINLGVTSSAFSDNKNLNCVQRILWGSNNYAHSSVRQWLNSNSPKGEDVCHILNKFYRLPSWNTSRAGFMYGLPPDFLAVVHQAAIPCCTNSVFETDSIDNTKFDVNQIYTLNDMFFILSKAEIFGLPATQSISDGEQLEYYSGLSSTERIKYDVGKSARICWMRTPYYDSCQNVYIIALNGVLSSTLANYAYGVSPACIIA